MASGLEEELPELGFQQGEGPAPVAVRFLLGCGHFGEGACGAIHLEDRVIPEAPLASGASRDLSFAAPLHLKQHTIARCRQT